MRLAFREDADAVGEGAQFELSLRKLNFIGLVVEGLQRGLLGHLEMRVLRVVTVKEIKDRLSHRARYREISF